MSTIELSRPMRVLVEEISGIGPGEEALVLTDDTRLEVARSLAGALRSTGASTSLLSIPYEDRGGVEPPVTAAPAMARADHVFVMTSNNLTHTDAHRVAQEAGTQVASMWGVTADTFLHGPSPENYEAVDRHVVDVKAALTGRSRVRITTEAGTDLAFSMEGRPVIALGILENDKSTTADYPQGEVAVAPVEGTAAGTVVVDVGMDVIGLVEDPIELTFEDGVVTAVEGGREAATLRRLLADADEHAGNLAEFAVGTNPDARVVEHIRETKKRLGTVHVAVGDSATIGGTVESDLHLDAIVDRPTVIADDDRLMADGELVV